MANDKENLKIFDIKGLKLGLSSHKNVRKTLENLLPQNFEDLKIPFYISTTNLTTARHEVFSSGNLIDAVLASISIPLVFKPIKINDCFYADGGLVKNLPASVIRDKCSLLIGSHVNSIPPDFLLEKTTQLLDRAIRISIHNTIERDIELCDIFIEPKESGQFNVLNFKLFDEIALAGYQAAIENLKLSP